MPRLPDSDGARGRLPLRLIANSPHWPEADEASAGEIEEREESVQRVVVALVLLAIGIAVPVGVLVKSALESAALEEASRHASVAARVFDEMERALTRFLEREEARPFNAYRFYLRERPAWQRSPLSRRPAEPFVVGYFQIDPNGALHTPRRPRDREAATARGDYRETPEIEALEDSLRASWARANAPRAPKALHSILGASSESMFEPAQSFHLFAGPIAAPGPQRSLRDEDREETAPEPSTYDVFKSLNRAGERRAARKQKVTLEQALDLYAVEGAQPAMRVDPRRGAIEDELRTARSFPSLATATRDTTLLGAPGASSRVESPAERAVRPSRGSPAARVEQPSITAPHDTPPGTVRIALDPMIGRPAHGEHLVLYRTVVAGEQGYRQGLLIDWRRLGQTLASEVVAPSDLASTTRVTFFGSREPARTGPEPYVHQHRFAEPFDAFGVELGLLRLPGGRRTEFISALAGLLALVAAGGLFAVYRMVAVVVDYADRRSRFVAAVSHELKTPLTSIRMYGEMLRDGLVPSEEKRAEYISTITDESERLSRLIDNVLDFSLLEKGEREVHPLPGAIRPVLEEAVRKLAPHAAREGFALTLLADESLPSTRFDRDIVTQVIFNLVDNALKYARGADRKEIEVTCCASPDAVELSVRDYGPGVSGAEVSRIFEPFFRSKDELTRAEKGTGIGLALVKELVEAMGASIDAKNAPGGGLQVTVRLAPVPASVAATPSS